MCDLKQKKNILKKIKKINTDLTIAKVSLPQRATKEHLLNSQPRFKHETKEAHEVSNSSLPLIQQ